MEETAYVVLSALGPDRPGLVAEVTDYLSSHGANVEDSRMAVFGAEFGMMILVSGTRDGLAVVGRDIGDLRERTGLDVTLRPTRSPYEHRRSPVIPCVVVADAFDHEGIVRSVTKALREAGANIVSLETTAYEAPVTGSPLFRMEARVDLPKELTLSKLRTALAGVADEENLDIEVRPLFGKG